MNVFGYYVTPHALMGLAISAAGAIVQYGPQALAAANAAQLPTQWTTVIGAAINIAGWFVTFTASKPTKVG